MAIKENEDGIDMKDFRKKMIALRNAIEDFLDAEDMDVPKKGKKKELKEEDDG